MKTIPEKLEEAAELLLEAAGIIRMQQDKLYEVGQENRKLKEGARGNYVAK